jgi:hypothetical protein
MNENMNLDSTPMRTYPFEHFKKQMPKEIQELITPESRTDANEFETLHQAAMFGIIWSETKDEDAFTEYYNMLWEHP